MHSQREDKKNEVEKEHQSVEFNSSRRKLTKAGIISPVIMSLSSKPVFAQIACTQSGMLSGNVSVNYDAQCDKPGLSRQYYIDELTNIPPRPICAQGSNIDESQVLFSDVFNPALPIFLDTPTLGNVILGEATIIDPNGTGNGQFYCETVGNNEDKKAQEEAYLAALYDAAKESVAAIFNARILPWYEASAETEANIINLFNSASGITASSLDSNNNSQPSCSSLVGSTNDETTLLGLVNYLSSFNNSN